MKKIISILSFLLIISTGVNAQHNYQSINYNSSSSNLNSNSTYVKGYYKSNGTYVQGYYRTKSNNTNLDNYSTKGNINPYTGASGTRAIDYSPESYNYGSGKTIHTGPRGGQYYINSNGNKTYVPKR